jgi:hypothetical protein
MRLLVRDRLLGTRETFWLPGPPALTSATYARDYNEVKDIGGKVSTVRTADQTEIARFWFEGPGAWNTIARSVLTARGLDALDSARVLALMNFAMAPVKVRVPSFLGGHVRSKWANRWAQRRS